jgi:ubiquinone/menaquinone biosynthesis C-methylase UbiE
LLKADPAHIFLGPGFPSHPQNGACSMTPISRRSTILALALLLVLPTGVAWADPGTAAAGAKIPPSPEIYEGRKIATTMHYLGAPWLVRESREREEECTTLLRELRVKPGQVVCDLGCGNGFYALKLAELVGPKGKVHAVDIQPEMLELLRKRARGSRITNVVPVLGSAVDARLPENHFDLVLLVDVYHEFSHPQQMLAAIRKSLKPTGVVALAEFRAEDPEVPIKPLHKMSKRQILKEFPPAGFKLVRQFDGLPWQHLMFFARDDASGEPGSPKP